MRTWSFVSSIPLVLVLQMAAAQPAIAQPPNEKEGWIPLFNGKDLSGWKLRTPDGPNGWTVESGEYVNTPPSTDILTEQEFYDFELYVEFKVSEKTNSGLYLRDKYEVQILNSHGRPVSDNASGALYRRIAPAVNAARPAGEWQTCEVTFVGRRLTVVYNGQKVLDGVDVGPKGTGAASDRPDGPGPLRLQGDHQQVTFRNIWIRPLPPSSND
jgi:hypothetical protein